MRIESISLSWFRGAASLVSLEPKGKSIVVYGTNGAGKSCFVDAVEYITNDGKVGHLSHEYSGKRQEKAILNTHIPSDETAGLKVKFSDRSELSVEISKDGSKQGSGAESVGMQTWDYRRMVLRQDEVAAFIRDTKALKYSALLPLLGLHPMEVAADNFSRLVKSVEEQSQLKEINAVLREMDAKQRVAEAAGPLPGQINKLHKLYCPDKPETRTFFDRFNEVKEGLDLRILASTSDQRLFVCLQDVAALDIKGNVGAIRVAIGKLVGVVEPHIEERLGVLEKAGIFAEHLDKVEKELSCPACGRLVLTDAFREHIKEEQDRLQEIIDIFKERQQGVVALCQSIRVLQTNLKKSDAKSWRSDLEKVFCDNFAYLDKLDTEALRDTCDEAILNDISVHLQPIIDSAIAACKTPPPGAEQLSADKNVVDIVRALFDAIPKRREAKRAEALISFIRETEQSIRADIKIKAQDVSEDISGDVRRMWAILHPNKAIEECRLYIPDTSDKAIDISLKFYGVVQESPRLTLSEGYRNSLGLCIFLAMAKRDAETDRPLFLDDVVVSLDRNHRGMVAELLESEFPNRQVIVLTHDRDWYIELSHQLNSKNWEFRSLLPYDTPVRGICWSHKTTTFDDARFHLKDRPDSAVNDARKIMDVELSIVAEKLRIRVPYLRGDRNDKRMALEWIERLSSAGKKCFQKQLGKDYSIFVDGVEAIEVAGKLLVTWGNRGSHSFDVERPEAEKLIQACEKAINSFKCESCEKWVWYAPVENHALVQCQCGGIRWRFGKE